MKQRTHNSTLILTSHAESNIKENCEVGCVVHDKKISEIMNVDEALRVYNEIIKSNDSTNFLKDELLNEAEKDLEIEVDAHFAQEVEKDTHRVNEEYMKSKYER